VIAEKATGKLPLNLINKIDFAYSSYMSMVLKICIRFEDSERPDFRFVLKVPLPTAISSMIDSEKEPESKEVEEQKNEVTI
jgi:hypothetical protein